MSLKILIHGSYGFTAPAELNQKFEAFRYAGDSQPVGILRLHGNDPGSWRLTALSGALGIERPQQLITVGCQEMLLDSGAGWIPEPEFNRYKLAKPGLAVLYFSNWVYLRSEELRNEMPWADTDQYRDVYPSLRALVDHLPDEKRLSLVSPCEVSPVSLKELREGDAIYRTKIFTGAYFSIVKIGDLVKRLRTNADLIRHHWNYGERKWEASLERMPMSDFAYVIRDGKRYRIQHP
jgi:hypothetical protein